MHPPRPFGLSTRFLGVLATATLATGVGGTERADAAAFSSWSVSPSQMFSETYTASETTTAAGRVWQVSFSRPAHPVLRSRRLTDGRAAAVPLDVPRPPGGELVSEDTDGLDAQLFVVGTRGFLSGSWCTEHDSDYDCERTRSFYVQFSTRTGRVVKQALTGERRELVGGTRISYLTRPEGGRTLLRDALTGRVVRRLPHDAREVQGAGRYVAWKDAGGDGGLYGEPGQGVGPDWAALHVRERVTGRVVYDLRNGTLSRAIHSSGGVLIQVADLVSDGSLALEVDVGGGQRFRPVVVDARGRVRRITERPMRHPTQFWSEVRGNRALLSVFTNGNGKCGPVSEIGWLTDVGGHRGNGFGALPHSANYRIGQSPDFLSATALLWLEYRKGRQTPGNKYRVRVGRDLRALPLTKADRPRC